MSAQTHTSKGMGKRAALGLVLLVGLFLVSFSRPVLAETDKSDKLETYKLLNLFGDVFERVRSQYVEEPSDQELIETAISGMLSALDPHSSYMNAKSYGEMQVQTRGEFGGLGIEVTMENGVVKVVSPIDDTPAWRAGLKPGDLITHLDGEQVFGLTLSQAVEKMRGKVGADITLTVFRQGKDPFDVTLTRAIVKIRSVRSRLEENVGYVRVTTFNEQADIGLKKAIKGFVKERGDKLEGVVLDLRNNPGGLLDQAIKVTDVFLERGEIVSTRTNDPEVGQRFNARKGDLAQGLPVVVLINAGSASASEIVAGALQDHGRALILGTKSFGKGSVQTIIPLQGYGAMRLTTARYYTPSGRSIQSVGIEPDVNVPQAHLEVLEASGPARREGDLRGALKNGQKTDKKKDKVGTASKDAPKGSDGDGAEKKAEKKEDYQLSRALDLIRGLKLFSSVPRMGG